MGCTVLKMIFKRGPPDPLRPEIRIFPGSLWDPKTGYIGSRVQTTIQQRKTANLWVAQRQLRGYHEISDVAMYFSDPLLSIAASMLYCFFFAPAERQAETMTVFPVSLCNPLLIDIINRLIGCINWVLDYINRLSNSINHLIHGMIQQIIGCGLGQGPGPRAAAPPSHLSPWRRPQGPAGALAINESNKGINQPTHAIN